MNIQSMEYILALSKILNFTKAASAMQTTQPAFSRIISSAEEEIGIVLFERSRRHVVLTPAGEAMIPQIERSLRNYNEGLRLAKGAATTYAGKLKIGYIPDTINQDIRLIMDRFTINNPSIATTLLETHYYELQSQVMNEELDMVIYTSMQTNFPAELEHYPLFETPLCVIVHDTHPLAKKTLIEPADLRDEAFVVLEHDATMSGSWGFVQRFTADAGFTPWIVCQTSMLSSALLQVSCNKGLCIASQFAGHLAPEGVKIIPIADCEGCVRYALWRKDNKNPALQSFVDCVKNSFEFS